MNSRCPNCSALLLETGNDDDSEELYCVHCGWTDWDEEKDIEE